MNSIPPGFRFPLDGAWYEYEGLDTKGRALFSLDGCCRELPSDRIEAACLEAWGKR